MDTLAKACISACGYVLSAVQGMFRCCHLSRPNHVRLLALFPEMTLLGKVSRVVHMKYVNRSKISAVTFVFLYLVLQNEGGGRMAGLLLRTVGKISEKAVICSYSYPYYSVILSVNIVIKVLWN